MFMPASQRIPQPRRSVYRAVFALAAVYNVIWGAGVILFPTAGFDLLGVPRPDALGLQFWQCIGMFVLVFSIGYAYLARDPERYAPFALIALLGKIFGPLGFVWGWWQGTMPGVVGWTILTNDLLWWPIFIPFVWETMLRGRAEAAADA